MSLVPEGSVVLDIGGGNGWVADELADRKRCTVSIIDNYFRKEPQIRHRMIHHDLKDPIDFELPPANVVLLMDVIEHIPRQDHVVLLDRLRRDYDDPAARVIISVPNTSFLPLRISFALFGRLNYGRRGILDDTHAFLFTKHSLRELMEECGYDIHGWYYTPAPFALAFGDSRLARILTLLHAKVACWLPSLFAFQNLIDARPRPTVATLIRHSFENSKSS